MRRLRENEAGLCHHHCGEGSQEITNGWEENTQLFSWLYLCLAIVSVNMFLSGCSVFIFVFVINYFSVCILFFWKNTKFSIVFTPRLYEFNSIYLGEGFPFAEDDTCPWFPCIIVMLWEASGSSVFSRILCPLPTSVLGGRKHFCLGDEGGALLSENMLSEAWSLPRSRWHLRTRERAGATRGQPSCHTRTEPSPGTINSSDGELTHVVAV